MEKLKSRKLMMSVFATVLIVLNEKFQLGLSQETVYSVLGIVGAYLLGQGVADAGSQGRKG